MEIVLLSWAGGCELRELEHRALQLETPPFNDSFGGSSPLLLTLLEFLPFGYSELHSTILGTAWVSGHYGSERLWVCRRPDCAAPFVAIAAEAVHNCLCNKPDEDPQQLGEKFLRKHFAGDVTLDQMFRCTVTARA
ncbi:unnamed protein product [Symbiodinium natans]|uniref:Uncharacterized protein n=1 Tax=Symbiodinium natans TaxID=878477 RepID=A0A812IHR5_9DINO|nr:unnamed protein product [Symbiodinium natans]